MFRKRVWIPILIVLLAVMGCGLFYNSRVSTQEPVKFYKRVEVETSATPKPLPPGETAESGHWHGDEWHAEPHETPSVDVPSAKIQADDEIPPAVSWSPVAWSNPLMPDEIPAPLKMPPEWVNWDYMALVEDVDPVAYAALEERLRTLRDTVIETYNPKRPIEALWPAFIDTEKQYQDNSDHAKKYPVSIVSGFRADWYYQGIWNFPEIHEMIRSQGGLSGQWYDVFRVEMGDLDPDWNLFHLHDGRSFRIRDDKNYQFYTDYNERLGDYSSTYSFSLANPNTAETIHVYPDTLSDAELKALQGWDYNINPYTGKNISR